RRTGSRKARRRLDQRRQRRAAVRQAQRELGDRGRSGPSARPPAEHLGDPLRRRRVEAVLGFLVHLSSGERRNRAAFQTPHGKTRRGLTLANRMVVRRSTSPPSMLIGRVKVDWLKMLVGFPTPPHREAEAAQSIRLTVLGLPDRFVITD